MESYLVTDREVKFENWYIVKNLFSDDEIEQLFQDIAVLPKKKANILSGKDNDYRESMIKWIPKFKSDTYGWIYEKVWKWVDIANKELWDFDLVGMRNDAQYTEYNQEGHYDWHMDILGKGINHRKISVSVLLNKNFEGGELEFKFGRGSEKIAQEKGDGVIFPSFYLHKVNPVTYGKRKSLVQWISGKPYK